MVAQHRTEYGSQWAAIESIASKIGCTAETLRHWVRQAERDEGKRAGLSTSDRERLKQLERESGQSPVHGRAAEPAVGGGLHVCGNLAWAGVRRLRSRCVLSHDRWLASQHLNEDRFRAGRP